MTTHSETATITETSNAEEITLERVKMPTKAVRLYWDEKKGKWVKRSIP